METLTRSTAPIAVATPTLRTLLAELRALPGWPYTPLAGGLLVVDLLGAVGLAHLVGPERAASDADRNLEEV